MVTVPNTPINTDGNALQASLQDSITTLVSHMAADASLRASLDLAKRKLEGATAVHDSMQNQFQKYPGIEERTSKDKSKALENVTKLDQQLKENSNIQTTLASSLFEAMWTISSKASASAQVQGLHPDAVSRKEYDSLQDQFKEQQSLLAKQQDQFEKQASLIKELEKTVTQTNEAAVKSNNHASITDRNTKMVNALDSLLHKVESTVSSQGTAIEKCESKIAQNKSDIAAREVTLTELDRSIKSATSQISDSRDDHSKLERRVTAMKNDVGQIWDDIMEKGKPPVVQRLKSHDVNINNLWTKVNSGANPIDPERIRLLEERLETLTKYLNEIKEARVQESSEASARTPTEISLPSDLVAFKTQVHNDATELAEALSLGVDSHTTEIAQLQQDLQNLQERLEESRHDYTDKIRHLDSAHNDKHKLALEERERVSAALTTHKDKADALQSSLDCLQKTVKSLQERPAPATTNATPGVQFRPVTTQSPVGSSPIAGASPNIAHTNNVLPLNGAPAPQNAPNGTPVVPNAHEIRVLQDQMNAAWAHINNLRQRYDNLTTEEVVKSMADQFSKMYPVVKDLTRVANTLQAVDKGLDVRLNALSEKLNSFGKDLDILRRHFNEDATKRLLFESKGEKRFQELQKDLENADRATAQLREEIVIMVKDAEKRVDTAVTCQTDTIVDIRDEVRALADIAFGKEGEETNKKKPEKARKEDDEDDDEDL